MMQSFATPVHDYRSQAVANDKGSIPVLLARASPDKVHPDFPAQPRSTRITKVTRARPAPQQVVATFPQVFLPADGAPAEPGANVLTSPQHSYVQLLHLLCSFVGEQHRVPAINLGLVKQHAELVVLEVVVTADGLHVQQQRVHAMDFFRLCCKKTTVHIEPFGSARIR
jgi:hypothetical protein